MTHTFKNSWALVRASARVLGQDKELLLFPVLSVIGTVLVVLSLVVPVATTDLYRVLTAETREARVLSTLLVFLFYLGTYLVTFFCQAALVGAALIRLRGGDPTVGDGLRIAARHVGPLLAYALLSATVGLLLRWLSERTSFLGRIVVSLLGATWSVASYLTVPVLVTEGGGALDAVRRSAQLLKQTWGEQIVGNVGLGAFFGWITLALFLFCMAAMFGAVMAGYPVLLPLLAGLMIVWLLGASLVGAALRGIYMAAVYRFVTKGQPSALFDETLVRNAFRHR